MITCKKCHTQNPDGAQYCDECGTPLREEKRTEQSDSRISNMHILSDHKPPSKNGDKESSVEAVNGSEQVAEASVSAASPASSSGGGKVSAPIFASATSAPPDQLSHYAKLTIHRGRSAGKEFIVNEDEAYIGRWDADSGIFPDVDLDADDPEAKVSRRHARITRRGEQYFIEDLGSTNGTFVNRGRRLLPGDRQPLHDGDEIIIGKTFLRFEVLK